MGKVPVGYVLVIAPEELPFGVEEGDVFLITGVIAEGSEETDPRFAVCDLWVSEDFIALTNIRRSVSCFLETFLHLAVAEAFGQVLPGEADKVVILSAEVEKNRLWDGGHFAHGVW